MANPFDQFDANMAAAPSEGNPFDAFDPKPVDVSQMDPGKPRPGGRIERPADQSRWGDALKPYFGGHNPVAETADLAASALDPRSSRPLTERVVDTANFAASLPFQMMHLPTPGQMAEAATGFSGSREAEERFARNNPDLLRGMDALGTVALQTPLGQGARMPEPPSRGPARPLPAAYDAAEDTMRARRMKADMERLDVEPFAPVVAAARTSDNSPGAITQSLADKPFVGTPIQRGANKFVEDMANAQERIVDDYGPTRTMQGAGSNIRSGLEQFREGREIDVKSLPMEELQPLAASPPRLSSFKDVAAAKYELAERLLPEDRAKGQPVGAGETRLLGDMPATKEILRDIKRRFGLTINKSEAAASGKGKNNTLSLEGTPDFANPRWTGSPNIDRSLDAIISAGGRWRTGVEGMREIRSMIRRAAAAKPDSEVNALAIGDLKRLYGAVSKDMDGLLERAAREDKQGNSARYLAARDAYKDADNFYRRYNESFDAVKQLLNLKDESAAGAILTAMKDGSKGNLNMLLNLRKALPGETIDNVAGAILVELGRPTGRAGAVKQEAGLSPAKFASQWDTLSEPAKKIIFGRRPELKRDLDAFARVGRGAADFEALANHSRTGVSNWILGVATAGGAGLAHFSPLVLASTIATLGASRAAAHFLTSAMYVRWLTEAQKLVVEPKPNAIRTHMRQLENMVRNDANLDNATKRAVLSSITAAQEAPQPQQQEAPVAP